ncbi:S8 family serine peptidase [Actinoplanes teichomyceticus]|uniref:Subtilase family protein n=1 Tax=Actinoplanes teichomyceticus TaxID=1867 RepID=A0A561WIQ5_ACTTI|nr:S8 family serine peptidase [Actinoplanes teichomyceticus]TWG23713.1 subtilase family protein [Actinoplanes teichomyceticus]GIF11753.1 hypothetical protein Ate01nite_17850 [Actinoplanes teichomyceticus]
MIAAGPPDTGPVTGLAPRATILPVRVVGENAASRDPADPADLARGVDLALRGGAEVIVVAAASYRDSPSLRAAVAAAVARDVPVIAAAGELGADRDGNPTPYPAAHPDVIGVGAIDRDGRIAPGSPHGDYVDLVAPGVAVPTLQGGDGPADALAEADGTALAAGYVGATAALIRNRHGRMPVARLTRLLTASASPAAGGDAFGAGVVNPYAAVTGRLAEQPARALPALPAPPADRTGAQHRRRVAACAATAVAAVAVGAVLLAAAALRRSRRQGWRPVLAARLPTDEPVEPGPPVMLLEQLDRFG